MFWFPYLKSYGKRGGFLIDKKSFLRTDLRRPFIVISHSSTLMTVLRPALKPTKYRPWGLSMAANSLSFRHSCSSGGYDWVGELCSCSSHLLNILNQRTIIGPVIEGNLIRLTWWDTIEELFNIKKEGLANCQQSENESTQMGWACLEDVQ